MVLDVYVNSLRARWSSPFAQWLELVGRRRAAEVLAGSERCAAALHIGPADVCSVSLNCRTLLKGSAMFPETLDEGIAHL